MISVHFPPIKFHIDLLKIMVLSNLKYKDDAIFGFPLIAIVDKPSISLT